MARPGATVTSPLRRKLRVADIKVIDGIEYRRVRPAIIRDPNAPRLKPAYLEVPLADPPLPLPLNDWMFEGRIVLPPQRVTTREGLTPMARIIVGYRQHMEPVEVSDRRGYRKRARIVQAKLTAFGDLAIALLENYRQGDHVRTWGGFGSWNQRLGVAFCAIVQRVEMVERAADVGVEEGQQGGVDLADTDAVLKAAIGGG